MNLENLEDSTFRFSIISRKPELPAVSYNHWEVSLRVGLPSLLPKEIMSIFTAPERLTSEGALEDMLFEILFQDLDTTELLWKFASEKTRQKTSWRLTATADMILVLTYQDEYRSFDEATWQRKD